MKYVSFPQVEQRKLASIWAASGNCTLEQLSMSSTVTISNVTEVSAKRRATEAFQTPLQTVQPIQYMSYIAEIPVLANSIFLNVQPRQKDANGNRFGAKFVGYRTLPDGSHGPAEKQKLIHSKEDFIHKVDDIQVEFQKFDDIITLLSQCCKRNEVIQLEMKTKIDQHSSPNVLLLEPKAKKQTTASNRIMKSEEEETFFLHLSSVKRNMSIEDAHKSAAALRKQLAEAESTVKMHDSEVNRLIQKIKEVETLLSVERRKKDSAKDKKEKLSTDLTDVMELTRPDKIRILEELKRTIVYGASASISKGRAFMNDLLLLNERKELLEAAHLIGASKNPPLLEGALQVFVENCSNSTHPFVLQSLFRPILQEGASSAFNSQDLPWCLIAEGIALAGTAVDAELFVKGILICAEKMKTDNRNLAKSRSYGYGSICQENRKCHILDIVHPSWEVACRKFKKEHASAKSSLEGVLLNYLRESVKTIIPIPSYCMQVEADIALGEGDKELSAFLRSENFSVTLVRSEFDWMTLERIIHDRINDAYTMLSYTRNRDQSSTNSILIEKVGIGRPEAMNILRDRQHTHAHILNSLTGKVETE